MLLGGESWLAFTPLPFTALEQAAEDDTTRRSLAQSEASVHASTIRSGPITFFVSNAIVEELSDDRRATSVNASSNDRNVVACDSVRRR